MFNYIPSIYLFIFLILSGCSNESELAMRILVNDNLEKPLPGAIVSVDGKDIGQTDGSGVLDIVFPVRSDSFIKVEVKKSSAKFYYAPYFQSLRIGSNPLEKLSIQATLYSVPKEQTQQTQSDFDILATTEIHTDSPPKTKDTATEKSSKEASALESKQANQKKAPKIIGTLAPKVQIKKPIDLLEKDSSRSVITDQLAKKTPLPSGGGSIAYPKQAKKSKNGALIYTILTRNRGKSIPGVTISWGDPLTEDLKKVCTSNSRGRCVIRFRKADISKKILVAKKDGFQTKITSTLIKNRGKLTLNLNKGMTIDIFAVTRRYQFVKGLENIEVSIDGKKVGMTNRYGQFSFPYKGVRDDLVEISLHSSKHTPSEFRTDFIASGDLTLIRQFSPINPPKVRISLLDLGFAGGSHNKQTSQFSDANRVLEGAVRHSIFDRKSFQEFPKNSLYKTINKNGQEIGQLLATGWQKNDLKSKLDAIIVPTLVFLNDQEAIELSVVGSSGRTMASVVSQLSDIDEESALITKVSNLAERLLSSFPFEGSVLANDSKNLQINIGKKHDRNINIGESVSVYGLQVSERGQKQTFGIVAAGIVDKVNAEDSNIKIINQKPRSIIVSGDIAVLDRMAQNQTGKAQIAKKKSNSSKIHFHIASKTGKVGVGHANIYWNGSWLGSTSTQGHLEVAKKSMQVPGVLKIIKYGFDPLVSKRQKIAQSEKILLQRTNSYLRVHSTPSGALVYVDGVKLGMTPFSSSIAVPSGFIKLEISGRPGFKTYSEVLELEGGTLELVGPRQITLEKDYFSNAKKLIAQGDLIAATKILDLIEVEHSDYLVAQHQLGELYLTMLDDPVKAAVYFERVTTSEAVRSFQDKRFIGSHINEAMAIFLVAENIVDESAPVAQAHYAKAIEIFDRIEPYLRFVPASQHDLAVQNVTFHRTLAQHRLYGLNHNAHTLRQAYEGWKRFLDEGPNSSEVNQPNQFREHATVYMKQASAMLNTTRKDQL